MNIAAPAHPADDSTLAELAALGMRAARVVVRLMEIEQAAAEVAAGWLVGAGAPPASLDAALAAGQEADAVAAVLAQAVPRAEGLARALDRVSRSVRRTVALRRRMEAGWTGAGRSGDRDDRAAMVRRQVARGVGDVIRRATVGEADGEAAERLFDELAERLEDPGLEEVAALPVEVIVRLVCRDLGLAVEAVRGGGISADRDKRPDCDTC